MFVVEVLAWYLQVTRQSWIGLISCDIGERKPGCEMLSVRGCMVKIHLDTTFHWLNKTLPQVKHSLKSLSRVSMQYEKMRDYN